VVALGPGGGDGSYRVEITDETASRIRRSTGDGGSGGAAGSADRAEAERSGKPVKVVIRDPYFMAATVIMIKRLRA